MKFGKLTDIRHVNFDLAPSDERTMAVLGAGEKQPFQAYVGCPVWGNKDWIGKIYPKGAKAAEYLRHYSASFNTIELNSTHYRSPAPDTVLRWKNLAQSGFVFCPKVPQSISHYSKLRNCREQMLLFADAISRFEEKMGHAFIQLHPSFGPHLFPSLEAFLGEYAAIMPLAIEFRHPDWFQEGQLIPQLRTLLEQTGASALITDVAGRRDVAHTSLTTRVAMVRFVGNMLDPSDYTRVDAWMDRLAAWVDQGLERLYFFVHEPDDTFAPDLGGYVIEQLNQRFGLDLPLPGIPAGSGEQMRLF